MSKFILKEDKIKVFDYGRRENPTPSSKIGNNNVTILIRRINQIPYDGFIEGKTLLGNLDALGNMPIEKGNRKMSIEWWADFWFYDIGANIIPSHTNNKITNFKCSDFKDKPIEDFGRNI